MRSASEGRLDVAAVLASLYPVVTIVLAAWFLKERTTSSQALGMALALGAVVLVCAIRTVDVVRNPHHVVLDRHDPKFWEALEDTTENQLAD